MESLKAKTILAMNSQPATKAMALSMIDAIRSNVTKVSLTGLSDVQVGEFKKLIGNLWSDAMIAISHAGRGKSAEIAKQLSVKCADIFAKMEALEAEYITAAKLSKEYKATGYGGIVLYIRAK